MAEFYIKSDRIFLEKEIFSGYIKIKDKIIEKVGAEPSAGEEVLDYTGKIVAPGFFDTHVHGYGGYDIMDCKKEALLKISEGIVKTGVTSFLATTLTDSAERLDEACRIVGEHKEECRGAKVEGIFLEGPFFTEKYKGAQNPKYMGDPDIEKLRSWKRLSGGLVKKIAIAPERKGSIGFIREALKEGIRVALGHSQASYEEAKEAVDAGASIFVHTYNGMSPLAGRAPGMVGAALATENTFAELICDGCHVHPACAKIVMRAKSRSNTVLITDCMMAGGMPEGNYKLGEFDVIVDKTTARLESGSLAGSILRLCDAVKNVVEWGIAEAHDAVNMASIVPARSLGMEERIGSIAPGKAADLNILDGDLNLLETYIDGERRF